MAAGRPVRSTDDDHRAMFIRAAQQLRERIRRNTEDARSLRESIAALQAAEQPDHTKVRLLERELATVQQQIRDERNGLRDFELEILLNC